jgi:hypothetical protein
VGSHTAAVLAGHPEDWSAYRDEQWRVLPPGTCGLAPRVLHLFRRLGMNPGTVPASNLVFVRSRREAQLDGDVARLANECWPFHELVVSELRPKARLCIGKTAGDYVREKLSADRSRALASWRRTSAAGAASCSPRVLDRR